MSEKLGFAGDYADRNFFTTDQVAQILSMTPRTVRSFIKSKKLRAAKFGGEWRVSKEDLVDFMEKHFRAQEADGRYEKMNNEVREFINGDHMEIEGPLQICTIVDFYEEDKNKAIQKRDAIWEVVNSHFNPKGEFKGEWHYEESEGKSRFVLWSNNPRLISELLEPFSSTEG